MLLLFIFAATLLCRLEIILQFDLFQPYGLSGRSQSYNLPARLLLHQKDGSLKTTNQKIRKMSIYLNFLWRINSPNHQGLIFKCLQDHRLVVCFQIKEWDRISLWRLMGHNEKWKLFISRKTEAVKEIQISSSSLSSLGQSRPSV